MKQRLGKYRIDAELGKGAMGSVFKAWHPGFQDYVALKTIQDTRLGGGELLDRFKVEGQNLAKLNHQNIVRIYDADQADGEHFIVMEYMNGGSLDRIITGRESVPLAKRVGYLVPVCHALDHAHKRGLFHRDIKPANIMLHIDGNDEIVKVVDFGIARLVDSSQTLKSVLIGAPAYMAPELISASTKANERTDIWALGVTLYELTSYQRPFEGNDLEELKTNIVRGLYKPLTQIVPDCPKDLSSVVEKALQKDPRARYQTVEDLLLEFEPIAKRLRTDVAGSLVRRAKDLLAIGEFQSAKSALNEAIKYDATNPQARSLLQNVDEELRRKELLPRLQEDLRRGRNLLADGQYREARAAAEHAIGLDSRFEPAHQLLGDIQEAEALAEEIQQKLNYAQRCVLEGELTEASRTVDQVLSIDPENHEAISLNATIRTRRDELERRKKLIQFLRSADDLLIVGKYDECLSLLNEALGEFPDNVELQKRKESALAEKSEQLRQSLLNKAKKLRTSQRFDEALEILDELLAKFPNDSAGVLLRSSIQKERDQEHLNRQLGVAWEELRSLKHQGKFSQALDLARGLVAKFPSEGKIKEFVRELEAEIRLDQQHAQLDAAVNKIQEFIRRGQLSQAVHASEDALKLFPNTPLLVSLRKEATSQQHQKEILEKQDDCISKVRRLISARQFKEAAELARKSLVEFGENAGLRDALVDAERYYSSEIQKIRQQDQIATKVLESCEKSDVGAATLIFQNAEKEGVIEKDTPLHTTLIQYIRKAKDQEQKEREVQIELRRHQVSQAVDQKDFAAAIRLADEFERDFGPDRKVSALRGIAESGIEADRIARQERDEVLQRASTYLDSGNVAAADQIVRNSLETGILNESDPQVVTLLRKTKEILDRDKERKKRVQGLAEALRELLRKGNFAGAIDAGQSALETEGHYEEIADLIKQAKVALVKEQNLQKKRVAELRSIRSLLAEGDPHQATRVLEDGLRQGVLTRKDREVVELQLQVEESIRSKAKPLPPVKPISEETSPLEKIGRTKWVLGGIAAGVLAFVVGGFIYFSHPQPQPHPTPPLKDTSDEVYWGNAETAMNRSPKDFRTALDDYEKVAELHGEHQTEAQPKIDEIRGLQSREELLLEQAQEAVNKSKPDYSSAIELSGEVIKIDGDRKQEAEALLNRAERLNEGKDSNVLAGEDLDNADKLAAGGKWADAEPLYQSVNQTPGLRSDFRRRASDGFKLAVAHVNEESLWQRAVAAENENRLPEARDAFEQASEIGLGHKADAEQHIKDIDTRINAGNVEKAWLDLKGRIGQSVDSRDKTKLLTLQGELKPFMNGNAPHSAEANSLDRTISENLAKLDAEVAWQNLSEKYARALNTKDKASLGQILNELRPFMNESAHAEDADNYTASIEKILNSPEPQASDEAKISKRLLIYKEAFETKDIVELRSVWPTLTDGQFKKMAGPLQLAKSIQVTLDCAGPKIAGNTAEQSCQQMLQITADGPVQLLKDSVTFHWRKLGTDGDWAIESLK